MNTRLENGRFLEINELYAFISKDGDGSEGVIGMLMPDRTFMPFIGADLARVEELKPHADRLAEMNKRPYEIRYFKRVVVN